MKIFSIILLISMFSLFSANGQEIEATVSVNMEQIDPEKRINVSSMERDVQTYINNQRFTNIEWEGPKIPVDLTIYLSGGNKNIYTARLFVASRRHLLGEDGGSSVNFRIMDNKWVFDYAQGANLSFNQMRFDDFSSLIDYYMMIVIGLDLDTYGELDGAPAYDLAKQIVILGANKGVDGWSTYASMGEYTRHTLVTDLTDLRYHEFRKIMFSYYNDGLDLMHTDKANALANVANLIDDIANFKEKKMVGPSALFQAFFDAKSRELATLFEGYPDKGVFDKLIYLDPTNAMLYQESSKK